MVGEDFGRTNRGAETAVALPQLSQEKISGQKSTLKDKNCEFIVNVDTWHQHEVKLWIYLLCHDKEVMTRVNLLQVFLS